MAGVTLLETESVSFAQTDLSKTTALSTVTAWAKCVPFFTRRMTEANSSDMSDWAEHCLRADINSTPEIVIDRTGAATNPGDSLVDVQANVVQFGAGVNVYRVPYTLGVGADVADVNIGATVVMANTFVNASHKQTSHPAGTNSYTSIKVSLLSTTQIRIERSTALAVDTPQVDGVAYVVESIGGADWTVKHLTGTLGNGSSTQDIPITGGVVAAKSFLIATYYNSDLTDNNDNCPMIWIVDGNIVRTKRDGSSGDVVVSAQVVTFSGAETVQRGTFADTSVDASVTDMVVTIVAGQQCDITSVLGEIPTMGTGDAFWLNQDAGGDNEDIWIVDTFTSSALVRATKQGDTPTTGSFPGDIETAILAAVGHSQQPDNPYDVDITDVALTVGMATIPGPQSFRNGFAPGVNQQDIGDAFYMAELINSGADVRVTRGREGSERLTEGSWEVIEWELDGAPPAAGRRVMVR